MTERSQLTGNAFNGSLVGDDGVYFAVCGDTRYPVVHLYDADGEETDDLESALGGLCKTDKGFKVFFL